MYAAIAVGLGFIVGLAFAMPLLELMASMAGLAYLVAIPDGELSHLHEGGARR